MKNVIHINTSDRGGGAEEFALSLSSRENSILLVKEKKTAHQNTQEISKPFYHRIIDALDLFCLKLHLSVSMRAFLSSRDSFHRTYSILKNTEAFREADIVHLHNLHGEYFNFSAVEQIAAEKPIIWTLHDMWVGTGGEAYLIDGVSRQETLRSYPIDRPLFDRRKEIRSFKQRTLAKCHENICFVAPSKSHASRMQRILGYEVETIYLGVDTSIFKPRHNVKRGDLKVFIYNSESPFKDSKTVIEAINRSKKNFTLHVIGKSLNIDNLEVHNHGAINNRLELCSLMQQMDIGVFSSKDETFGLLPAELAACGAVTLLQSSVEAFQEHNVLYGAKMFDTIDDLTVKIDLASETVNLIRKEGINFANTINQSFTRNLCVSKYSELYEKQMLKFTKT